MQLLYNACVRRKHSGDEQNVNFAVLQRQIFATKGKENKLEQRKLLQTSGNFLLNSRHEGLHVVLDVLTVERAVQTTLKISNNLFFVGIIANQLLMV